MSATDTCTSCGDEPTHTDAKLAHARRTFDIVVRGRLEDGGTFAVPDDGRARYLAAWPADFRGSFSGSGQPFASTAQALDGTPNAGIVTVGADGSYEVRLLTPNSYYVGFGSSADPRTLVPPTLYLEYQRRGHLVRTSLVIDGAIPFRNSTWPQGRGGVSTSDRTGDVSFYKPSPENQAVRTQEEILRAGGYPFVNAIPADFWGGVPPQ